MLTFQFISMWPYEDQMDDDVQGGGEIVLSVAWGVAGDAAAASGRSHGALAEATRAVPGSPTEFVWFFSTEETTSK